MEKNSEFLVETSKETIFSALEENDVKESELVDAVAMVEVSSLLRMD